MSSSPVQVAVERSDVDLLLEKKLPAVGENGMTGRLRIGEKTAEGIP
jgi:hypothetical protein